MFWGLLALMIDVYTAEDASLDLIIRMSASLGTSHEDEMLDHLEAVILQRFVSAKCEEKSQNSKI